MCKTIIRSETITGMLIFSYTNSDISPSLLRRIICEIEVCEKQHPEEATRA